MTKKTVKLAIVADTFAPWNIGGRETRYSELLPWLADKGFDITVYTMEWWDDPPTDQIIGEGFLRIRAICKPRVLYQHGRRSFWHAIVFSVASLRLLSREFDVIETDSIPFFHLPSVWLVSKIRRRPLVIDWCEVWGKEYWNEYFGRIGVFGSLFEKLSTHFGDKAVTISRRTQRRLSDLGVDDDRLVLGELAVRSLPGVTDSGSPELLFVGRLIGHKRPDLAVSVIEQLPDLAVRLCIIGSGPMRDELETRVRKAELSDRVSFIERVSDEELGNLLRSANILIAPSEREGFGLVVAEALSVGTPVVTVDAPLNASQDLVLNGISGRICKSGDSRDLAGAVRELLDSPLDRRQVIGAWESLGVPKSYEEVADKLFRMYCQLLGERY